MGHESGAGHAQRLAVEVAFGGRGEECDQFDPIFFAEVLVLALDLERNGVCWLDVVAIFLKEDDRLVLFDVRAARLPQPPEMSEQKSGTEVVVDLRGKVVALGVIVPGDVVDDPDVQVDGPLEKADLRLGQVGDAIVGMPARPALSASWVERIVWSPPLR